MKVACEPKGHKNVVELTELGKVLAGLHHIIVELRGVVVERSREFNYKKK